MEGFQKFVLFSAIIILIIALIIIGITLAYSKKKEKWPPISSKCPDYWVSDGSGNSATCINVKDLGTCPPQGQKHLEMNFNQGIFTGSQGDCNKYNYCKKCGLSWDGITYGVKNPCTSSSTTSSSTTSS